MDRNHVLLQLAFMTFITTVQIGLMALMIHHPFNAQKYLLAWWICAIFFWILFIRLVRTK